MIYSRIIVEAKHNLGASQNIKTKAQELRKKMTNSEKKLWSHLRKKQQCGMYFRRQHPYGIYILDFYCFKANLAIEVDGEIHLGRKDYDKERTEYLESTGLRILRFKNEEIDAQIDYVLKEIKEHLCEELPPSRPSPSGGRS